MNKLFKTALTLSLFYFLAFSLAYSQNLVPNPSFEVYDTCPFDQNQVNYVTGWNNYGNSPEYFNSCSFTFSVPNNGGGYQQAATGSAYCGLYTLETLVPNIREFIGTQLISPLVVDTKYYVSFKANLAIDTNKIFNHATNNLGVLFSTVMFYDTNPAPVNNFAHIYTSLIITDTTNWTTIYGSFIADSAYQYIIIGNFFDDVNTNYIQVSDTLFDKAAYYFIDDVCVSTDSAACDAGTGIVQYNFKNDINIYPNPATDKLFIKLNEFYNKSIIVRIFDIRGTLVNEYKSLPINNKIMIDISDYLADLYIIKIETKDKIITKKVIISK